jgi:Carboxypeptidase regulatory-like domain
VRRHAVAVLILLLLSAANLAAEKKPTKDYALIFGTVFDPSGRPAQGVVIKITKVGDKKAKWERVSDSRGEFAQRVPVGEADYLVRPQLKDRQTAEKSEVKVHVQNNERQDIAVHLHAKEPLTSK